MFIKIKTAFRVAGWIFIEIYELITGKRKLKDYSENQDDADDESEETSR